MSRFKLFFQCLILITRRLTWVWRNSRVLAKGYAQASTMVGNRWKHVRWAGAIFPWTWVVFFDVALEIGTEIPEYIDAIFRNDVGYFY